VKGRSSLFAFRYSSDYSEGTPFPTRSSGRAAVPLQVFYSKRGIDVS